MKNPIPIPKGNESGGSKGNFRIDAKHFSLSFDDGQPYPYAIHKSKRSVKSLIKSSIWVGKTRLGQP